VANELIIILFEIGGTAEARCVFDRLLYRDVCLWNTLISGYINSGDIHSAFRVYEWMQEDDSVPPNAYTYVAVLKACAQIKDIRLGGEIHHQISRRSLLQGDPFVGSALVDMYMKCGSILKSQEVFDNLKIRDMVTWTALISGYGDFGHSQKTLDLLAEMQLQGLSANASIFACTLKACGSTEDIAKGQELHTEIVKHGLEMELSVASSLIDLYGKCGLISTSKEIFDMIPRRDLVLWTSLMAGYAHHGYCKEALISFEHMKSEGFSPNCATFVCVVKSCANIGDAEKGREFHSVICKMGFERDLRVGNTLVVMYAKCGYLPEAQYVFNHLQGRDTMSWNTLIMAYQEEGLYEEASNSFKQMQQEGICPNSSTFIARLKVSSNIGLTSKEMEIHATLAKELLLESEHVGNVLVDMYAKCGLVSRAKEVFEALPVRNVFSWTALIAGNCEYGSANEALLYFEKMQHEGISPNAATFVYSIKACAEIEAIHKGLEMHSKIVSMGFLRDTIIDHGLIDMYGKCGYLIEAQDVHDKICVQDVLSWTALISAYGKWGYAEEAIRCFNQMQTDGISPNPVTFICILKAYGNLGITSKIQELYAEMCRLGWSENDHQIGNTLVAMLTKCGALMEAKAVFDRLLLRDVVSWTALITGYVENGKCKEALECYDQMQRENVNPNVVTFISAIKACGSLGAIHKGELLHEEVGRVGLDKDVLVGSCLVDMYAKYGLLVKAEEVFDRLPAKDLFSWNALVGGYAQLGHSETVFLLFDNMIQQGVEPNHVTFLNVLNACNHAGLLQKGQTYYEAMNNKHGLTPAVEHNICVVDLFSRAGQVDKAIAMVQKIFNDPNPIIWHTLLSACKKWGNLELAREIFERAMQSSSTDSSAYICMSNIYADAGI
jgi:pentatricopeptide repeat protein